MQTRRFGRTEHESSLAIFGAVALADADPQQTEQAVQMILDAGVNHIDIAPSYGEAEKALGPFIPQIRQQVFLGCKTMERTRQGALDELQRSLERLQTDYFDLYQLHAVTSLDELYAAAGKDGALEGIMEAEAQGLVRNIGISGHGANAPMVFVEALRRYEFDSITFPINFIQYANERYRMYTDRLLTICKQRDVGVMAIKSTARAPWGERQKTFSTWYEPFNDPEMIQKAVNFTLSMPVTGICTVGDLGLLPHVLKACQNFAPMDSSQQQMLMFRAGDYEALF
jgi:predicted aldo/keto reductase-like oxidoreductase